MILVERASPEDLPGIWEIDGGNADRRASLMQVVNAKNCLVAKAGWQVVGFSVRTTSFFGYPYLTIPTVHNQQDAPGMTQAIFAYAEKTCSADRLFTSTLAGNIPQRNQLEAMGYRLSGTLQGIHDDDSVECVYMKLIAS